MLPESVFLCVFFIAGSVLHSAGRPIHQHFLVIMTSAAMWRGKRRAVAEFPQRAISTCWVCGEATNQLGCGREKGGQGGPTLVLYRHALRKRHSTKQPEGAREPDLVWGGRRRTFHASWADPSTGEPPRRANRQLMSRMKSQTSNPPSRCQTFRPPARRVMIPCSPGYSLDMAITLYLALFHARVSNFLL